MTTSENLGFYTFYFGKASANYELAARLTGGIDLLAQRNDYQDYEPAITDDIVRAGANLTYKMYDSLFMQLAYYYRTINSSSHTRDYVENQVVLQVTAIMPQPFRM